MSIRAENYGIVKAHPSHAAIVCDLIRQKSPVCCTLTMGYMVTRSHDRVNFSDHYGDGSWNVPRIVSETRNRNHRCTSQVVEYSDGSRVRFTWSERNGYKYSS